MPTSLIKRQAAIVFCVLTPLLTFAVYLLPLPRETLPFLMVFIPAILAIGLAALAEGAAGVRGLFARLGGWRASLRWFAVAIGLGFFMRLAISLLAWLIGVIPAIRVRPVTIAEVFLLAIILIIAAIPEELGWRGFALPRLMERVSPLLASLLIGVLWGLAHLALHLPGLELNGLPPLTTLMELIALSVLLGWLFIRGGGRLGPAIVFHAAQSYFVILNDGIPYPQMAWLWAAVYAATALIVIALDQAVWKA